jgi:peptidoglycan hydrolase-like protein with peptidoglycan-binding domain
MAVRSHRFGGSPSLAACLAGETILEPGLASGAVARVQQALMDLGYVLREYGPDGVFGHETEKAVVAFKAAASIQSDDPVIDSGTIEALDTRFASEPLPHAGDDEALTTQTPIEPERVTTTAERTTAETLARRAVDLAVAQAVEGAHHLHGAAGARPGANDGTLLQPNAVSLAPPSTDLASPAVLAAQCQVRGFNVCGGRFDQRNGGVPGGRVAERTDTDLLVYLAGLASIPPDRWQPFYEFFSPRRIKGTSLHHQIVWGEDCRGKRHFDGEGLVNWSLEQAVGALYPISFDIRTWGTAASGTADVALTDPPQKGDIVIRIVDGDMTHIGFLVGDVDQRRRGDLGHVVLAEQTSVGVVRRRFSQRGWTLRRRPTAQLLHD